MSLTSLPPELLLEVLKHLERDEDLYHLGLTCKHTHRPAFSMFLKKHKIDDPTDMFNCLSAYQYPPLLLPLIRASLWIKDIRHITCAVNPGYDRVWNDVRDLKLDWPHRLLAGAFESSGSVKWANGVTKLLDAAIERGCFSLDVNGGEGLQKFYQEKEPDEMPTIIIQNAHKGFKKKLTSSLKTIASRMSLRSKGLSHLTLEPKLPGPHLRNIDLNYSPMFQYTFYPWTLKMFSNNASTITHLSLTCPYVPTHIMTHFLSSITLPHLDHLSISLFVYQDLLTAAHTVRFYDLVKFLERHPSIESLDLQGVEKPETPSPILKNRILPRIKRIVAHHVWINTLIGFLDRSPDAYPLIESIGVTLEYTTYAHFSDKQHTYEPINGALRRIAQASFPRPITLELQLTTKRGMLEWFDDHTSLGKENSVISSLSCVSALVLTTRFYVCFGREEVYHLPGWLALFPALRSVTLRDLRPEKDGYRLVDDKPLLRRMAVECPTLELVNTINLGTLLDGAERDVGQSY
ncbi:hypothetical protein CPB83DRAFT_891996 [Crepidotus variabilis]|uniref:F-box domain-containing protein n=1 Tax=Crepidotus variabilis TaxID=179855 RepID=A0A9P6EJZ4_9AGAR|nr:hypothetical protein CPB83DRAFT_891996 [Crepidotus variabilis]